MSRAIFFALALAGWIVASLLSGCGGSADSDPAITVSVEPGASTVPAGGAVVLTATVQNDSAQMGVSWTISPASGVGELSDVTKTSATYHAPASAPANDMTVTITAASVADPSTVASIRINVPRATPDPITVTVTPALATVSAGNSQTVTATVQHDPSQAGVSWTISPASGAGELSDVTNTSATYHGPASAPANDMTVTVTATSVADHQAMAASTITVPAQVTGGAIAVTITPDSAHVDAGSTQSFTATVQNDATHSGVTWTISSTSGAGELTDITPTSATYRAPASPPPNDVTVTIAATAVADRVSAAAATIVVPAIVVSVDPASATVVAGQSQTLMATVLHDPSHSGVSWAISPESDSGLLRDTTATSATYRGPASPPPTSDMTVTITATAVADRDSSALATIVVPAIVVSVGPASATVLAGQSQTLTATVSNDPSHAGVTWTISPETRSGTLRDASDSSVTYDAPADPVSKYVTVTITATAVADGTVVASATITVPTIVVHVTPDPVLMPARGVQAFQATADSDPDDRGVRWNLTQAGSACSPTCGSLFNVDSKNATFMAPPKVTSHSTVTLTATSVTDATRTSRAVIELSTGTVQLVPAQLRFGGVKVWSTENPRTHEVKWNGKTLRTTLTNVGDTALGVSVIAISGTDPVMYSQQNDCGSSVAAGGSCNVDVTFAPHAFQTYRADLTIDDSSRNSPQRIPLSGFGCHRTSDRDAKCVRVTAMQSVLDKTAMLAAPVPTGPNAVGTRVIDVTDPARDDPYLANGAKRELLVRFWYPAAAANACKRAPYTSPAVWAHLSELAGRALPAVRTNSCLDARIEHGAFPVVVFSHGYTGTFTDYTFLFEDLASRGYVVASIGHTYESTAVSFPDGRFARSVLGSYLTTAPIDERTLKLAESVRVADVRFVVNELARLNVRPESPLAGHLDLASVAIAGHSLGGLTALESSAHDPRIRAVVVLDGVKSDDVVDLMDSPVLFLDAGRERWGPAEQRLWTKLRGPRFAFNLQDAEHMTPSDMVWIAKGAIDTGSMTPEQAVAATRAFVAAFLDTSLKGVPVDQMLMRPSKQYPHVEVSH